MVAKRRSGLRKVVYSKHPAKCLESGEDDTDNATPPKHHSNSNGEDREQISPPSGNIHPRLVKALSQIPYSPLFGVLWPIIVEQATFETRIQLREVNTYFKGLCRPSRRSDQAKSIRQLSRCFTSYTYFPKGYASHREGRPLILDLSFDEEWRCWEARK